MDKKTKEHIRRHKKPRPASSSESSSSSSDSDSGSSSNSYSSSSSADKKHRKNRKIRRHSSSSDDEKIRRREKHACHRKAEAKKNHLKRKIKEAKAKKRALSPRAASERKRHHLMMKERLKEKEREKLRLARERESSAAAGHHHVVDKHKYRAELKRKATSPTAVEMRHFHHQIPPREKIIIQTRRERSPSDRKISSTKDIRHRLEERRGERERADAMRKQERDDELVRCQRERERLVHEKMLRREKIKEYDEGDRLLPRPAERELAIAAARANRERSPDPEEANRHLRREKIYEHGVYEREYSGLEPEHEREYLMARRREISPALSEGEYPPERRGRDFYPGDERFDGDRRYGPQPGRSHYPPNWDGERGEKMYLSDKSREWKLNKNPEWQEHDQHWPDGMPPHKHSSVKWQPNPHKHLIKKKPLPQQMLVPGDENWDTDETGYRPPSKKLTPKDWNEQNRSKHDAGGESPTRGSLGVPHIEGAPPSGLHPRWPHHPEWRGRGIRPTAPGHPHIGSQPRGFRPNLIHQERPDFRRTPNLPHIRPHHPGGFRHPRPPFPHQSKMVYTNPNLLQNKAAQLAKMAAEKAAALSAASSQTTSTTTSGGTSVTSTTTMSSTITMLGKNNSISQSEKNEFSEGKKQAAGAPVPSTTTPGAGSENKDNLSEVSDEIEDNMTKLKKSSIDSAIITTTTKDEPNTADDDDLLDFEEISDGELEEESRKNLGDALGVDWASLVEDSKTRRASIEPTTTAKQKWQPHRIILDVGISLKYAGEDFAKQMLADAEEKLKYEEDNIKSEFVKIKVEKFDDETNIIKEAKIKIEKADVSESEEVQVKLPELACVQVAQRKQKEEKNNLIFKACGRNSRALTARKDLKLRRQLCGLPEVERTSRVVSDNMKEMAIKIFQKATAEVK